MSRNREHTNTAITTWMWGLVLMFDVMAIGAIVWVLCAIEDSTAFGVLGCIWLLIMLKKTQKTLTGLVESWINPWNRDIDWDSYL